MLFTAQKPFTGMFTAQKTSVWVLQFAIIWVFGFVLR